MEFYYPAGPQGFVPFLYQYGGQYYQKTPNGLRSDFTTEQAYLAFKAWTDLYDAWRVPLAANFFTRMETGEMPIGVADYPFFVQIQVAAPQLSGLWGMSPIPATPYECTAAGVCSVVSQGPCAFGDPQNPPHLPGGAYCKYNDSAGDQQESTTVLILKTSKHPLQAWKWVEWWTSTPVQLEFANDIEAIGGVQLAWNTANELALPGLPWPSQDIKVMQEAWSQFTPEPMVPGGYIADRYVNDIWTNVVINNQNPRAQLDWAVENINDELYRQEVQFGLAKVVAGRNPLAGA
jgi:ABC-type glycerol-3-phosphate transport system substrate-binding protein